MPHPLSREGNTILEIYHSFRIGCRAKWKNRNKGEKWKWMTKKGGQVLKRPQRRVPISGK